MSEPQQQDYNDDNEYDDGECWNCGGEGFTFDCFDGFCEDADIGCADCTRKCRVCAPRTPEQQAETDALRQVLADALEAAKDTP